MEIIMQYEIFSNIKLNNIDKEEWRWRLAKISSNKVIAFSAEAFDSKDDCEKSIHLNMLADYTTPITVVNVIVKKNLISDFVKKIKLSGDRSA